MQQADENDQSSSCWAPLDCSPRTLTKVSTTLGVKKWRFVDVFGLGPESLEWIPSPCLALILLFPTTASRQSTTTEDSSLSSSNDIVFIRQRVGGLCGTIAVLHAVANNLEHVVDSSPSLLGDVVALCSNNLQNKDEIGSRLLQQVVCCKEIADIHKASGVPAGTRQGRHFVTFVHVNSLLVELDGRRKGPIIHGPTTPETYLTDSAAIMRELMASVQGDDSAQHSFALSALVPSHDVET